MLSTAEVLENAGGGTAGSQQEQQSNSLSLQGLPSLLPHLHHGHHLSHAKKQCCGISELQYRQKPLSK